MTSAIIISLDKRVSTVETRIESEGDGGHQHQRGEKQGVPYPLEYRRAVLFSERIKQEIHSRGKQVAQ